MYAGNDLVGKKSSSEKDKGLAEKATDGVEGGLQRMKDSFRSENSVHLLLLAYAP